MKGEPALISRVSLAPTATFSGKTNNTHTQADQLGAQKVIRTE